jgi:hypothetical protein
MVQRARNAVDFVLSANFFGTTIGSGIPSIWYRMTPATTSQFGYKVQTSSAISGSNTIWSITLYYSNGTNGPQTVLQSGQCTIPTATHLVLTVQANGAKHDVWCNTTDHVINVWDYNLLSAGQVAIGIQGTGGGTSRTNTFTSAIRHSTLLHW